MIYYLLALLLSILAYLSYVLFIRPLKLKAHYSKLFKQKGYKLYEFPYKVYTAPIYEDWIKNQKQRGDFCYTSKHVFSEGYDLILTNAINGITVFFLKPQLIKQIYHQDMVMKLIKKTTAYNIFKYISLKGIAFIEKDTWKHRRRLISKVFNFQFITSQIPVMIETIDEAFQKYEEEYWKAHPQKRQKKEFEVGMFNLMSRFTSSIVISSFLGLQSMKQQLNGEPIQDEIIRLLQLSMAASQDPMIILFGQKWLKLQLKNSYREIIKLNQDIDNVLQSFINKHRQNQKAKKQKVENSPKSIVELILEEIGKEEKGEQNIRLTDQDLVDQIKTFVIAGSDTTSNYTTMALFMIFENKPVTEKLRSQIQKYIKDDSDITLQNIKKIKYFDLVLNECSRLFPTSEGIFERVLDQDTEIDGIVYKKGLGISYLLRPVLCNPKFFPQPFAFKPERWAQQTEETKYLSQIVSFQFSGGPRGCIGKHLGITEAKVMIIKFLKRYSSLVEPGINKRNFVVSLTSHLKNNNAILTKFD